MGLNQQQKDILLKAAKSRVVSVVKKKDSGSFASDDPQLNEHCGCFVTLKNSGRLRGCIGQFISEEPLTALVQKMAEQSVSGDPRFFSDQVTAAELDELDIEISVLSRLERTDDPLSLKPGRDGIYIKRGFASGCFLPQVATEMGWNSEQFLSYCCSHKAGLSPDAWQQEDAEVYLFTAEVFGKQLRDI